MCFKFLNPLIETPSWSRINMFTLLKYGGGLLENVPILNINLKLTRLCRFIYSAHVYFKNCISPLPY